MKFDETHYKSFLVSWETCWLARKVNGRWLRYGVGLDLVRARNPNIFNLKSTDNQILSLAVETSLRTKVIRVIFLTLGYGRPLYEFFFFQKQYSLNFSEKSLNLSEMSAKFLGCCSVFSAQYL